MQFGDFLLRWNKAHNLISRRDEHRIETRHLLDSETLLPYLHGEQILDCGSGAGLPGIPLAIAEPSINFLLLDRSERKVRFLNQVIRELKLNNVATVCADMNTFSPETKFDTIVSRAVASPQNLWPIWQPWLASGGRAVFQFGPGNDPSKHPSEDAWLPVGGTVITTKSFRLPNAGAEFGISVVSADV
jgi:16S rRNA (guanine527-N7)-methyltransferase